MRRVILVLVDGLRPDVAEAELAAGRLPHLASLTARGTRTRAATAFPSSTTVAYLPFLTGELPGRCNVPSIRWLDRATYAGKWWRDRDAVRSYCGWQAGHVDRDLAPEVRTIFQDVPESLALFSMITRGLTPERDPLQGARKFWGTVSHYIKWYQPGDDRVAQRLIQAADEPWRFIFAQFPAVDGYTHCDHPSAELVLTALRKVDDTVGTLVARLRQRGELEDTLILMVSDHGASKMDHHFDLAPWFRAQGVTTLAHPELWTRNPRVAVMVAGNASAGIYLNPGIPRTTRVSWDTLRKPETFGTGQDLVGALLASPAVALLAAENDAGGLRIASRAGEADLTARGDTIEYCPRTGDPLMVGGPFVGDANAWLAHTITGAFPDAAVSLLDHFASPRAADLIVAAAEGWDFRDRWELPEHKSGHGSLIAAHMLVPAWSSHPLPNRALRTVDLYPVIREWLDA